MKEKNKRCIYTGGPRLLGWLDPKKFPNDQNPNFFWYYYPKNRNSDIEELLLYKVGDYRWNILLTPVLPIHDNQGHYNQGPPVIQKC